MTEYSVREWSYLTHYHEYEWPAAWDQQRERHDDWLTVVSAIAEQDGLSMSNAPTFGRGSNIAVLLDEVVVKIFARRNPVWYPREIEALKVLSSIPEAKTPKLISHGQTELDGVGYSYIVMARTPGEPLRMLWDTLSHEDRSEIACELAVAVKAIHSLPINELKSFGPEPREWSLRMQARARLCYDYFSEDFPEQLLRQIPEYLERCFDANAATVELRLLHADLNGGNTMIEKRGGRWALSGLIDFGDAEVGPLEYEWVSLVHKALRLDADLVARFFEAYELRRPFSSIQRQRMRAYSLLHRFPSLLYLHEKYPEIERLDELIELLWPL